MAKKIVECKCNGCAEDSTSVEILGNGYCEECFDQGCDSDPDVH